MMIDPKRYATVDFETGPIQDRPDYPPDPVGVAIRWPYGKAAYYRWGHPDGNNCSRKYGTYMLSKVWDDERLEMIFHNAKFDVAVAVEKLGLAMPAWHRIHDTMFLMFLEDPHSNTLSLKPGAERYLDMPPDEQDELHEWLWERRKILSEQTGIKMTKKNIGAFIAFAPGDLVGKYAGGDVDRTWGLFELLYPRVCAAGMREAYDRERQLLPILLENERIGIRVDVAALERDIEDYELEFAHVEEGITRALGMDFINLDADNDVADALSAAGLVDDDKWVLTPSGQRSVSKDNLTPSMFNDPQVAYALGYRNRLKTCLEMFMRPWLRQAKLRDGWVSTNWNQVRDTHGGTCTGRPSTRNPNFLNIAKEFEGRGDGYQHPDFIPSAVHEDQSVMPLPLVRKYMLPDEGHVWMYRDFSGQEIRVLAHYESGALYDAYNENPDLDPHNWVKEEGEALTGIEMERTEVKGLNFLAIYGGGIPAIMKRLGISKREAQWYKDFHDRALPGRKVVNEEITRLVRRGLPVHTWGGRRYYVRRPKAGQTYEYQLINYLCQGSAADLTKQALIDWYYHPDRTARFLVTVYDEIDISCPIGQEAEQMELLRECMDRDRLDVPMRSDGAVGPTWGDLEEWAD